MDRADKSFVQKVRSKIPPLPVLRTTIKAAISVSIALIFVLVDNTRKSIGPASTLVTLGTLLYFPVKPIGIHFKLAIQGTLSATIGASWCLLGNYLANLARDPSVESPLQPASSVISAIFCFILIFSIAYIRTKFPQIQFITTFAGMVGSFSLTQNANIPGFQTGLTLTFMKPLLFATAIGLLVNIFLWPEDSATKYFDALSGALKDYNLLFAETTRTFISVDHQEATKPTFTALRGRLQNTLIKLVDNQHTVEFVVLYSRLSQNDVSHITQKIKELRTPLHGIGVSLLCKYEENLSQVGASNVHGNIDSVKAAAAALAQACQQALTECNQRVDTFKEQPRSLLSTLCWPFPRLFVSKKPQDIQYTMSSEKMESFIIAYETEIRKWRENVNTNEDMTQQVIYLFQFNLLGFANKVQSLVSLIEKLDWTRPKRRKFWFPRVPFIKWFKPSVSNKAVLGGQINERISISESSVYQSNIDQEDLDSELGLKSSDKAESKEARVDEAYVCAINRSNRPSPRNPDVDAPVTPREKVFNVFSNVIDWLYSMETLFAIKTATAFILLSLPAYLPQSVGWFTGWGGQWVANTLLMWMFPMAGMFNFTILFGLMGSILGCVLSIIAWEIVRGNPYGIAVLSFFVLAPFHYIFFMKPVYSFLAIMTQFAYLMVITTAYQNAVGGALQYDSIEMAAGKRMIFVVLGILASFVVNLVPRPVTGRVALRKRISRTFYDMGMLYGIIFADILTDSLDHQTQNQAKAFRQLTLHLQRQLKDEETYLRLSKLEPPLKGRFPFETYRLLIEKLNNMADLIEGMAYTAGAMDRSWRRHLISVLDEEKFDYVACLLTVMRQLSATLFSKMPLPPYMISPDDLKDKLSEKLCMVIAKYPEQIHNDTFPSYCAYSVASYIFTQELNEAAVCVEKLVGVESPQSWLETHK